MTIIPLAQAVGDLDEATGPHVGGDVYCRTARDGVIAATNAPGVE